MHPPVSANTALVLSGGGARGAYEAGVVAGLVDVLGHVAFQRIAGTSVGAINAAWLAANAHRPDMGAGRLVELWEGLAVRRHLRLSRHPVRDRAMLDVRPFERIVREEVDWDQLARNVDEGVLGGLFVAALEVATGHTAMFADLTPGVGWAPSRDPQRVAVRERITAEHVLASAAIPAVFPPRQVGPRLCYDGSLRFNTPMAPVLRSGTDRLVVVSPLYHGPAPAPAPGPPRLDLLFLGGKMLHAVLLDPVEHDLQVLERFNALLEVLDDSLDGPSRERFDARVQELRGVPYRTVDALVLSPSHDLGALALDYLRTHRGRLFRQGGPAGALLAAAAPRLERSGTDLVSYLLFDGPFTRELVALGRRDVQARADDVRAFFGARAARATG